MNSSSLIKTKTRIAAVIAHVLMLVFFIGIAVLILVLKIQIPQFPDIFITVGIGSFAIGILILWWTVYKYVTLVIDQEKGAITFHHPLRKRSKTYRFDEVTGLRLELLSPGVGGMEYKRLVFLTNDNVKYIMQDFEIENLRNIEAISMKLFPLLSKNFKRLNEKGYKAELVRNKELDMDQAKSTRFTMLALLIGIVPMVGVGIYATAINWREQLVALIFLIFLFIFLTFFLIKYLRKAIMRIRELKEIDPK